MGWQDQFVLLFQDLAGAVEGVFQPEIGCKRMMCCCRYDAIFDGVAFLQAEEAHGLDAHILVRGKFLDCGIRCIRDRAWQNFRCSAISVRDSHLRNLQLLKGAMVIESEPSNLTCAKNIVQLNHRVDFFAGISVCFEADARLQQLNLKGKRGFLRRLLLLLRLFPRLSRRFLRSGRQEACMQEAKHCQKFPNSREECHVESVGAGTWRVKFSVSKRFGPGNCRVSGLVSG